MSIGGGAEFTAGAEPTGTETGVAGGCTVVAGDAMFAEFPVGAGSAATGAELTGGGADCVTTGACDTNACCGGAAGGGSTEALCTVVGVAAGTLGGDAGADSYGCAA
ncbi:MAG TPA: hypothetical protein VE288_18805 [Rubrobacteraceae bacterium]|nr:hypothetical protein [Rubrobacteraceae bacterium]